MIDAHRDTLNRDMARFNLCFRVAFLAVLLPLTSGELCITLNQLGRFHFFMLKFTFRVLGWRFLLVLKYSSRRLFPMVAGWSSIRTEYTSERNEGPSGFLFFKLKCHLKKNSTVENIFAITSSLIWKRGELYESKIKLNYIQQFEIQTVLKLLFQRSNWVIRSASLSG